MSSFMAASCSNYVAVVSSITHARISIGLYETKAVTASASGGTRLQSTLAFVLKDDRDQQATIQHMEFSATNQQQQPQDQQQYLCVWLSSNLIVVWNLERGVVVHQIRIQQQQQDDGDHHDDGGQGGAEIKQSSTILSMACGEECFYVVTPKSSSSTKLYIHEYSFQTGKLLRKIKSGMTLSDDGQPQNNHNGKEIIAIYCSNSKTNQLMLRVGSSARILSLVDGNKLHKFKDLPNSNNNNTASSQWIPSQSTFTVINPSKQTLLRYSYATTHDGSSSSKSTVTSVPIGGAAAAAATDTANTFSMATNGNYFCIGDVLYRILNNGGDDDDDGNNNKKSKPSCQKLTEVRVPQPDKRSMCFVDSYEQEQQQCLRIVYADESNQVAVRHHPINYSKNDKDAPANINNVLDLTAEANKSQTENTIPAANNNTKRRRPTRSAMETLGPGQAGEEALTVRDDDTGGTLRKRAKTTTAEHGEGGNEDNGDNDEEDPDVPTIEERLEKWNDLMDQEAKEEEEAEAEAQRQQIIPKKLTTESLSQLLQQALQSGDDAMLDLALACRDVRTITTSLEHLDVADSTLLLHKMTHRVSRKPTRAAQLIVWISSLLKSGNIRSTQPLMPLKNLLQERVESFPQLLQLEGRLEMLASM